MLRHILNVFEPFVLALITTVLIASILPAEGNGATLFGILANAGIVLLFFLHGAKLSRQAIIGGARNWRLHVTVLAATFLLFPVLGLCISALPFIAAPIASGMLFLSLLPSTVQSSIAFTSIARGNVAAAVCSASFSNLIGIALTPVLVTLLMGQVGTANGISLAAAQTIALQLLLPFILGHLSRPLTAEFVARQKKLVMLVDRGSILLVVYTAFSAAVIEGLWSRIAPHDLITILILCSLLLAVVLTATWFTGKLLGFPREDIIVLLFCGSKKSLASGIPIASVLFPVSQVGIIILPLMLFHQIQLIVCAIIARRLSASSAG